MKKFSNDSYYPFIIIGLVCGGLHYVMTTFFHVERTYAFFGAIIAALIIYALIVEKKVDDK